ncbi:hypothetical protein [Novosphingobium sp. Fuku2-ISO-50]|uniref:hypothetical protein n=1 Tax=Novosphingobium sp. Fuku2-ISO-50 TaxID=1739114 RepID=UPI000A6C5973|nr:hypothetical protein [Novosphingobium sp. Fuku2-ISO-50]MDR3414339.1 hypothetical protein [Formivibrio sp.]
MKILIIAIAIWLALQLPVGFIFGKILKNLDDGAGSDEGDVGFAERSGGIGIAPVDKGGQHSVVVGIEGNLS